MRSAADPRRLARLGLLIALAGALHALEALLPSPVPWFRLGLGNAVVLTSLHLGGVRDGAWVGLGKVLVGGLLTGRLLGPGFLLALAGTAAAVAAMALALRAAPLGFVGVSAVGAEAHALAQLAVASVVLVQTPALWSLAPLLGTLALAAGCLTGLVAHALARVMEEATPAP
ncbi:MAG: Gx transporter family protein [Deferrisomatales bacterium]